MLATEVRATGRMGLLPVAGLATALVVVMTAVGPVVAALLILAPAFLALLVHSPMARLAWFIGGGMLVFGGSSGVGAPKLAYFGGVLIVATISWARVARSQAEWLAPFRPILPLTIGAMVWVLLTGVVAHDDSSPLGWVRDVLSYALLVCAPVIALDAAHEVKERFLHRLIGLVGLLTAIGFASDWLTRRGVSSLPFGRILLASGSPAALALGLAVAKIAARQSPKAWGLLALSIPLIMLTTGTRSMLGWSVVLLGAIGTRSKQRMSPLRAVMVAVIALGGVVVLAPRLAGLIGDAGFLAYRLKAALSVLQGNAADDGSYEVRQVAYGWAREAWDSHRWVGVGPGHLFGGVTTTLDTPLITLAKFGIIGTVIFIGLLVVVVRCGVRAGREFGWSPAHTAVRCFALVILVGIPFGSALEDKGFSFAVGMGVCALAVAARMAQEPSREEDGSSPSPLAAGAGEVVDIAFRGALGLHHISDHDTGAPS